MSFQANVASVSSNKTVLNIGILISGRGSNMAAILNNIQAGKLQANVSIVISNNPDAKGLELAKSFGIKTKVIKQKDFVSKDVYEDEIANTLTIAGVELVVLAGYMRVLGPGFIDTFSNRIINIHPSLLPAFKGLNAQKQALEYGVKIAGCTVHFVDNTLDGGRIILQDSVNVLDTDTEESLSARILEKEHVLYTKAIQKLVDHHLKL